ncbi:Alpha-D-ribose 1-methylphosphonate 5-triphosphate synthase subunit PhnH [Frigidibacter albus]
MSVIDLPALWRPENHQALFRLILDATARPGQCADLSPHLGGAHAALGVLATFCDNTQTLADLTGDLTDSDWRFLDVARAPVEQAAFILARGSDAATVQPRLGSLDAPEGGATLIVKVSSLSGGTALALTGPGIKDTTTLHVTGLAPDWLTARARWCAAFPLGCDMVLADETRVAVLPRTTKITEG